MAEINKMYNQCICWVLTGYGPGTAQVMPVHSIMVQGTRLRDSANFIFYGF